MEGILEIIHKFFIWLCCVLAILLAERTILSSFTLAKHCQVWLTVSYPVHLQLVKLLLSPLSSVCCVIVNLALCSSGFHSFIVLGRGVSALRRTLLLSFPHKVLTSMLCSLDSMKFLFNSLWTVVVEAVDVPGNVVESGGC